jgi:hypothetical protein
MKRLMMSLIKSLPALGNVVMFLLFIFILFGILGVQLHSGDYYNRCRKTPAPVNGVWEVDHSIERLCSYPGDGGLYACPEGLFCGNPREYGLAVNEADIVDEPFLFYGITTFDNLGAGLLTVF